MVIRTQLLFHILALLGSGMVAGVFLAFSNFVMQALQKLPAPQGISTMQQINLTVINPLFMGLLFGTALLSIGLAIITLGYKLLSPS